MEIALCTALLVIGFVLGYAFRAGISQHRRTQAMRRRQLV